MRRIARRRPANLGTRYRLKIRRFLEALALGMTPHEAWDGDITIPPHFRIGKHTFHPYQRTQLRDYLYHHTYFEHLSTSRYGCGALNETNDERTMFTLPLQIRYSYAEGRWKTTHLPCHAIALAEADLQSLGYTALTIWECEIKSILANHTIPNLPPREAAIPTPDYSPRPPRASMPTGFTPLQSSSRHLAKRTLVKQ